MLHRILPRSLLGQMLLSVALALLVAQSLGAFLLFQAGEQRREAGLLNQLAFQLIAEPSVEFRDGRRGNGDHGWRRLRLERAMVSPILPGEDREQEREEHLGALLQDEGIAIAELVVIERPVALDRYIMSGLRDRPRWRGPGRWDERDDMIVAGLLREGEQQWIIARVPEPQRDPFALGSIIAQTLLLYVVLVGGLYVLLRRITRPLGALTARVGRFAGRPEPGPPLELSGPDDTRRLIAAHNAMEARISGLIDEKDVMLGAIGHDLKTPLASLRVRIESVEDDGERAKMAATIEDISRSLDDILSLARVGRPSDPLERTDLAALVSAVVEEYEDMGENVLLGDTERCAMALRGTWLRRALRNLIDNALRYGGQAEVSLVREGERAIVRVADSGPGIPESELASMLEPFVRGEASRNRETGGAGLGLTLARAIAEQHGGTLTLANRRGDDGAVLGLLAELSLPLAG